MAQAAAGGVGSTIKGGAGIISQLMQPTNPLAHDIADVRGGITGQGPVPRASSPAQVRELVKSGAMDPNQQQPQGEGSVLTRPAPEMTTGPIRSDGTNQTILTQQSDGSARRDPSVSASGVRTFESKALNRVVTPQNVSELSNEEAFTLLLEMDPELFGNLSPEMARSPRGAQMLRQTIMGRFGAME